MKMPSNIFCLRNLFWLVGFSILALLAIPLTKEWQDRLSRKRWKTSINNIFSIAVQVENYHSLNKHYPLPGHTGKAYDIDAALQSANSTISFKDGFGHDILYLSDKDGMIYSLISIGKNGKQDYAINLEHPPQVQFSFTTAANDDVIMANGCWIQAVEDTPRSPEDCESYENACYAKMLRNAEEVLIKDSSNVAAKRDKSIALSYMGHYPEAESIFEEYISHVQNDDQAFYYCGSALFNLERFKESIPFLSRAIQLNANNYKAKDALSWAYYFINEREKAMAYWDKECMNHIKLHCADLPIIYPVDLGNQDSCKRAFEGMDCLRHICGYFVPQFWDYHGELLRLRVGDKAEAIKSLQHIINKFPYFEQKLIQDVEQFGLDEKIRKELLTEIESKNTSP